MLESTILSHKNLELREILGQGGSGAVYRAHQAILDREVAVKVILPSFANRPEFIRSFELEAQTVARLEHPHIVPLYDFWRDPEGAYIVMRFLRAGSLKKRLEQGRLSLDEIDRLLDQLSGALMAAHRNSVVHRDLKPDNVLLDEDGNAYLSDFGIAQIAGHSPTEDGISGTLAYMAPEQLMSRPANPSMDIYSLGIILFELMTGTYPFAGLSAAELIQTHINNNLPDLQDFDRELPFALNDVVQRATAKKPDQRFETVRDLWRGFHRVISSGDILLLETEPVERRNPYKGLRPFEEAEAGDFFGRESLIAQLLERIEEDSAYRSFLAVVGASGSGKSSLIQAGLLPQLRSGKVPGSDHWFISQMVPGDSPLAALTQALLSVAPGASPRLADQLMADPQGLLWAVGNLMASVEGDLLLVVDQFEELFTMVEDEAERAHFLALLREAVSVEESRFRVIITLRADFYDRPLLYEGFGEIMQQRTQVVLPLNAAEIERAITGPAEAVGMEVSPGLVAAIVDDMREEPGALPLLQYALTEVYERCEGNILLLEAYRESGGVEGALARRAEDVYHSLNRAQKGTAQQIFLRLVTLGEHAADTRRRATQSELFATSGAGRDEVEAVLGKFGDYRLLAFDRDSITREPTVEIAHEALIRGWARLREWLDTSREDLQTQRQLASLVQQWIHAERDESYLLYGTRLAQFNEWAEKTSLNLSPDEQAMLTASVFREVMQQEQARLSQRRMARLRRWLVAVLAVGLLISGGFAVVAFQQGSVARSEANLNATAQSVAEQQAQAAESARATTEANAAELRTALDQIRSRNMADEGLQALQEGDVDSAIALAYAANQVADPPQQVRDALARVGTSAGTWKRLEGHNRDVVALAFSPDGQQLVSGSFDRSLIRWDMKTGQMIDQLQGHEDLVLAVDTSPDGRYIVSGDASGVILLWDAASGELVRQLVGHSDKVQALAFSPDSQHIVSASSDRSVLLWDVEQAEPILRMEGHDAVLAVDFSPDGQQIVAGAVDGSMIVWDSTTGAQVLSISDESSINSIAFNPQGGSFVSGGNDNALKLWDSRSGEMIRQYNGHRSSVAAVAFSPDGDQIVSASADNTLRLWDTATGRTLRTYTGHRSRVRAVAFSPRGGLIASGSADNTLRLWLTETIPMERALVLAGHHDDVKKASFSPDETRVLSGAGPLFNPVGQDTRLILWDWTTGQIIRSFSGHSDSVTSTAWLPDGRRAISASRDSTLILWDTETGEEIRSFQGHYDWVWSVAVSPDGKTAISASRDSTLILWDIETGAMLRTFSGHYDWVNAGVFSPDGKEIVSSSDDGLVIVWNTESGEILHQMEGHEGPVHDVAISPTDPSKIVSGSSDWTMILWDADTGEIIKQFFDDEGAVNAVNFSPDGQTIVSGASDGRIILRSTETGEPLREFDETGEIVRSVEFSPDGQWLLASFDSGLIRVYPLTQQVVMDWIAQNVYLRPFDCAERQQFALEPACPEDAGA